MPGPPWTPLSLIPERRKEGRKKKKKKYSPPAARRNGPLTPPISPSINPLGCAINPTSTPCPGDYGDRRCELEGLVSGEGGIVLPLMFLICSTGSPVLRTARLGYDEHDAAEDDEGVARPTSPRRRRSSSSSSSLCSDDALVTVMELCVFFLVVFLADCAHRAMCEGWH